MGRIRTYVALGDSFTEGLNDPYPGERDRFRGWADRLAEHLDARDPGLRYANLAVRGKLVRQIVDDQVPRAVELSPDLVTFCGGGNDMLRPGADPDALAVVFDDAVRRLRATGARVVVFTGFDPRGLNTATRIRGRAATFNMHLRAIADRRDCDVVDLWSLRVFNDRRAWFEDRLHLSPEGHRRMALRVAEVIGVPVQGDWREPWPPPSPAGWLTSRRADLHWARAYLLPWIGRRATGRSSGDGRDPKRPNALPL
ncbi:MULTISPECIES: SGNH/GDSL hydrolase family protein [Actinomadura]|uniref:SGNH/GDSL hydrolase family protein n=1 Tax=Actinomadura litoris TaxID=2678616 RepID=A0A7K1KWA8_9ACTN|nr:MULTISPECIES: SGNH/GDSL hydrolase family protein [Actinomadura]MBT2211429.1 SGNH/GDSL hydrolase family protein [Actinomadura sp. NEAU-AAG7]MUN36347.1 SGNH/GDSL hydrolase family protein [Actinomadura litoris]